MGGARGGADAEAGGDGRAPAGAGGRGPAPPGGRPPAPPRRCRPPVAALRLELALRHLDCVEHVSCQGTEPETDVDSGKVVDVALPLIFDGVQVLLCFSFMDLHITE